MREVTNLAVLREDNTVVGILTGCTDAQILENKLADCLVDEFDSADESGVSHADFKRILAIDTPYQGSVEFTCNLGEEGSVQLFIQPTFIY